MLTLFFYSIICVTGRYLSKSWIFEQQVDAGLRFENRKEKYQFMFNVKTPSRIYYLVAESEADMNKWVNAVCQVCELKAYTQDEEQQCQSK